MPNIVIDSDMLRKRGHNIRKLISPLVGKLDSKEPAFERITDTNSFTIGVYSKKITSDYRDWRFNTLIRDYKGNYFEVWKPLDRRKQDNWYLEKAYLQIFKITNVHDEEKEYICLHTDPEEAGDRYSQYKKGPHFHIKIANEDPISKAHLAIGGIAIDTIIKSHEDLFATMKLGIAIICDEILRRI